MAKRKKKLSDKLESMKSDELSSTGVDDLLNEEVEFDGEVTEKADSMVDAAELESVAGASPSDKTSEGATAVVVHDESTYRDIQAHKSTDKDSEKVSYGDVYEVDQANESMRVESVESLLKQSEHLRVAQEKINELESELEDMRRENDELVTAADTFKNLSEDYYAQLEKIKSEMADVKDLSAQEVRILKESLAIRDKQLNELKQTNADLKAKVETNFKHIRKRERDLEYRLELAKVEETALLKTKDKTILELRRKIDKIDQEMSAYRDKNKEHYQQLQEQQQTVRSVVRALRIALTRLEGDFGVDLEVYKKAE